MRRSARGLPDQGGELAPAETAGYDYFVVTHEDLQLTPEEGNRYLRYWKTVSSSPGATEIVVNPASNPEDYLTRASVDWFADWYDNHRDPNKPWFAYLAFFAAHHPVHCPPIAVYPGDAVVAACDPEDDTSMYYTMIHTLSVEIDRLLRDVLDGAPQDPPENTLIILASDNGSPPQVIEPPFDGQHAKGTVYEGGIRVPLMIGGDLLQVQGELLTGQPQFVHLMDLFPTILHVAGVCPAGDSSSVVETDGVSLVPFFTDAEAEVREFAYSEWFSPNFDPDPNEDAGPAVGQQAVRDADGYKIVKRTTGQMGFFFLPTDPNEEDHIENPQGVDLAHRTALINHYSSLQHEGLVGLCDLKANGEECTTNSECCSRLCELVATSQMQCTNPDLFVQ